MSAPMLHPLAFGVAGLLESASLYFRRDEIRASMREDIDKCIGKRVTDSMMACVKRAETAEKIDKCLR